MRILVLHSELGRLRGGGENFTRNLFTAFAARGHRVAAAFVADRKGRYPLPLPDSIEPIPIPGWWSRTLGQQLFSRLAQTGWGNGAFHRECERVRQAVSWRIIRWHNRRFQRRIQRELTQRCGTFDAVYVHGDVELAAALAGHWPTILRLPGPVTDECRDQLQKVQVVCANGDALSCVRTFFGESVVELPIGIDAALFRPGCTSIRHTLQWTDSELVVGYVGRLTHIKGVDILASAFQLFSRRHTNARLLMIGSGEAGAAVRSIVAGAIDRGVVRMIPDVRHEQLPDWYRAMDVFVMPSRYENWSNAVVEAMACGIPVIASDVGGNCRLNEIGTARLFEPQSVDALSRCLGTVAEHAAELKARGEAQSCCVRSRYSWSVSASRLENLITSKLRVAPCITGSGRH